MANVELASLTKVYPERKGPGIKAVNGIDLSIQDREFMVLVGPSGCGKSTTLRMIAGLESVTSGQIRIDGRVVNDIAPKDRDIAMVFQNYALYPHMSVYDNMAFALKLRKLGKAAIDARVREAAQILGIEGLLARKPRALSGGQRQRVAVGRAIVRKPKVFLFDEPLSNLDAKMRVSMRAEISRLHARLASTMIYVTHDQVEAMTMGDRICVMNGGDIMQVAEPLALYSRPANKFVAGFIGNPPMNFLEGVVEQRAGAAFFVEDNRAAQPLTLRLSRELAAHAAASLGKPVTLGIRPEDIHDTLTVSDVDPEQSAAVTVEVSEPMGSETILYLNTGAHTILARLRGDVRFGSNQPIKIAFDMDKARLFDAATGVALAEREN